MSTGGGPDDGPGMRQEDSSRHRPDAPPWERSDLPAWLTTATAAPPVAAPPARRPRGLVIAVLTVTAVLLAGAGTLVAVRRGGLAPAGDAGTNAIGSSAGQATQGTGPAATTTTSAAPLASPRTEAEIRARIEAIERDVTRVRGLRFERKVPAELLPVDELKQRVQRQVDTETDESEVRAEARALALLGQAPAGTDLVKLLRDVQVESVLGYYVPGTGQGKGRLYVRGGGGLTPFAEFVLSHELTHAVTDQRFDLTRTDRLEAAGRDEELVGYLALVEGDATYTMQRYYQQEMTSAEQLSVARESLSARTPVLDRAPAVIKQSIGFPYQAGMIFVQALYQRGGWAAVNRAYADPPTSSEQILHPDKYLSPRDDPRPMAVPDLRRALGAGWRGGVDRNWGEADARFLLADQVPVTAAKDAAAGWDGGQLRTFQHGARTALALRTVWDSPQEASEFCQTMGRWASGRFGVPTGTARWAGGGQHAALLCEGDRATWLSAPDAGTLDRLRGGLGGNP